jgi:cell division protein FtsW
VKAIRIPIQGDRVIWVVVVILSIFSLLAVYSSTRTLAFNQGEGGGYYLVRHLGIFLFGLSLMYIAHLVRYPNYAGLSRFAILIAIPLLLLTLFKGASINEAKRWVIIPVINLSFQTSDFAKLALTMFLARTITLSQDKIQSWKSGFLPLLIPILLVCLLILPSNFSTAAILFASSMVLLFVGRARVRHILLLAVIGAVMLTLFVGVVSLLPEDRQMRLGTWSERIARYSSGEMDEVYQLRQSKIAIASGGIIGKMPGNSIQRNYLPNPFSDFIYAIIIEEYGLAGGVIILFLYLILLFRSIRISVRSPGTFGALLAVGLGFSLVFQAMINMAVATGLLPVTGQPLPLVSMGGTSIWFTSISIGIMLSISRETEDNQDEAGQRIQA